MKDKKRLICFSIIAVLAIALVFVTLFVPMVHIVGKDDSLNIVYDKTTSLVQYATDIPFLTTAAADVYFTATGPIWMGTTAIMLNYLVVLFAIVLFAVSVFEIASFKVEKFATKNNTLARKIALVVGYLTVSVVVFEILSFILTTTFAGGYAGFYSVVQNYIVGGLGAGVLVCAYMSGKKEKSQTTNKVKNAVGYGISAFFSAFLIALPFIPIYSYDFFGSAESLFSLSLRANEFASDSYGEVPIGITTYAVFAMILVGLFVLVYSIVGLILTLKNKETNWLSARTKRWSMALLIVYIVLFMLSIMAIAHLFTSVYIEGLFVYNAFAYIAVFLPFVPYIASTMISWNKVENEKSKDKQEVSE